jgi:hypothetical protein
VRQVGGAKRLVLVAAACSFLLAACGGGGGDSGAEGRLQVISFNYPGGATLQSEPVTLTATASSGLPVTFRSATPSTCTVSGNQLTLVAAGECLVVASQSGGTGTDGTKWAAADETSQLFNVLKLTQTPVLPVGVVLRASGDTITLSATTSAGLPATYASTTPAVCTASGTTLSVVGLGLCQLSVTAPTDPTYGALSETGFIQVVSELPPVVQTQGQVMSVVLGATDADGQALTYTSSTPAVCEVVGRELRLLAKGACDVAMSSASGASENFTVNVDPRVFASGFNSTLKRTAEFGEIGFGAGVPIAGWCGGATPSYCNLTVTGVTASFSFDIKPASNPDWTGSTQGWWAYYGWDIGAPRNRVTNADGSTAFELVPFEVPTESSLFLTLGINQELFAGGGDVFVRIRTNHYQKKADGSDCYVTVSAHLHPASADPTSYLVRLDEFAVTNKCDIASLPQTEGWMFDWGVSAESKAAALAEIRAHGIRAIELAAGSVNLARPTPNADGSVPATNDPAYTLSTTITVYGPITVQ